jgi:hypothetical protein
MDKIKEKIKIFELQFVDYSEKEFDIIDVEVLSVKDNSEYYIADVILSIENDPDGCDSLGIEGGQYPKDIIDNIKI